MALAQFEEAACFQQQFALCACGRDGSRAYFAHNNSNHACFLDFCDVRAAKK